MYCKEVLSCKSLGALSNHLLRPSSCLQERVQHGVSLEPTTVEKSCSDTDIYGFNFSLAWVQLLTEGSSYLRVAFINFRPIFDRTSSNRDKIVKQAPALQ